MLYLISQNGRPLEHMSCGQLLNENGFIHPKRQIDSFVLIVVIKGTLCIYQNENKYNIGKNQYLLLFSGHEHGGISHSDSELSYYWCHFKIPDSNFSVLDDTALKKRLKLIEASGQNADDYYVLPEHGDIKSGERISILFSQMLDNASDMHSRYAADYALSLLATSITSEFLHSYDDSRHGLSKKSVSYITEWIKSNYALKLSVNSIAWRFNYNPSYLSIIFKRYTGTTVINYINTTRINVSKQFLLETDDTVKSIAMRCGFSDEKHFMKTFKSHVNTTPTKFRTAFYKKHINS